MQLDRESCAYSGGAIYEGAKGRFFNHFARGRGLDHGFEGALGDTPTAVGSGMRTPPLGRTHSSALNEGGRAY